MLLAVSVVMALVCGARVARFFVLKENFVVVDSYPVCEMPLNNRCIEHYKVYGKNGSKEDITPFGTEFESGRLFKGVRFEKNNYGFSYKIDNTLERWPFLIQQLTFCLLGFLGIVLWYALGGVVISKNWLRAFVAQFNKL
jgi:hypothetical protein